MISSKIFLLAFWIGQFIEKNDGKCDVHFTKIGCFADDHIEPRPLPSLLSSDRDGSSGHTIDWEHWDKYIDDVICRCAKETAKNKFGYFSLQFYGECWSGRNAGESFPRAGKSSHCVSKGFEKCKEKSDKNCVGESLANFVYLMSSYESLCHVKFKKVGCYNNNHGEPHRFPIRLFTDSPGSKEYSNVTLDFINWNTYIMDLACRCAAKTKQRNFKHFTLQSFGECWSGPDFKLTEPASEDQDLICYGKDFKACTQDDVVCVGQMDSNYVYNIVTD